MLKPKESIPEAFKGAEVVFYDLADTKADIYFPCIVKCQNSTTHVDVEHIIEYVKIIFHYF